MNLSGPCSQLQRTARACSQGLPEEVRRKASICVVIAKFCAWAPCTVGRCTVLWPAMTPDLNCKTLTQVLS